MGRSGKAGGAGGLLLPACSTYFLDPETEEKWLHICDLDQAGWDKKALSFNLLRLNALWTVMVQLCLDGSMAAL